MMEYKLFELQSLKTYDKDLAAHGCGYWSVCWEHGHSCPCASTSAVMQGFSLDTWVSLLSEMKHVAEDAEKEDRKFLREHGCTFEQYVRNGYKDEPYEDFPWPSGNQGDDCEIE